MKGHTIIASALLLTLVLAACQGKKEDAAVAEYKTIVISHGRQTLLSEYTARLTGCQVVEVRPEVSGLITDILINEGDKVRQGQLLFVIDQVPYRAELSEAEAKVSSAEATLANEICTLESAEKLHEGGVIGDYELTTARNNVAVARAALAEARAVVTNARSSLSDTEVRSPVDGVAGMIGYRVGALVSSSIDEPLVTVSDDRTVYAYFSMTEAQIIDIVGQHGSIDNFISQAPAVRLRMSNGQIYTHEGRIAAVSRIVSSANNAVTLRADFPNPDGLLREGGAGTIIVPTINDSCIVIPQTATFELQDRIFAYKVVGGKAVSVPVNVFRLNNGKDYIVESGLNDGDTIIAEGAGLIREGQSVVPQPE